MFVLCGKGRIYPRWNNLVWCQGGNGNAGCADGYEAPAQFHRMLFLMSRFCGKMSTLFPAVPCVITAKIANFVGRFVARNSFWPLW
jgi:hypothetical protein